MWDVVIAPIFAVIVTLVCGKFYYKHEITKLEMLASVVVGSLISVGIYFLLVMASLQQTEIWNGVVEDRIKKSVSCEHSYEVCTGSGDKKSCTTMYEHFEDYDWIVQTNVGDVKIKRVDDQGSKTPPRWFRTNIGEPASVEHYYTDYLKGNSGSMFHVDPDVAEHWKESVYQYPNVYDYYRVQRVLENGEHTQLANQINSYLNEKLITLGESHQVNIIVVLTEHPRSFFNVQMQAWEGGKKNDVILFYGLNGDKISWFQSTSFFEGFGNNQMHSLLRQQSVNKEMNLDVIKSAVSTIETQFVRNPMENNKYMLLSYDAPWWVILLSVLLSSLVSGVISWAAGNNTIRSARRYS